jgi:hypothetical protein
MSKNVQVKKTHPDQYSKVPKPGDSLSLFDPVIGLVELWRHFIEVKKQIPKREVTQKNLNLGYLCANNTLRSNV